MNATIRQTAAGTTSSCTPRLRFLAISTVFVLALVLVVPTAASARDSSARKVGRGAANLTLGVLALPGEIVHTTRDSGVFVGATWGFVKGVAMFVTTEVVGLFEVLTCPFETPPGFKPILEPEYPWGYFTKGGTQRVTSRKAKSGSAAVR